MADFECEPAARAHKWRRGCDQFTDQLVALRSAIKRNRRIVLDFARELRRFASGDVGKVGNDEVVFAVDALEEMALRKPKPFQRAEALGVFACEVECILREIDRVDFRVWKSRSQRKRNHSTASANVEHARIFRPAEIAKVFHKLLGFGAGDEGALIAQEDIIAKVDRAEKML